MLASLSKLNLSVQKRLFAFACVVMLQPNFAHAIDLQPGEIVAPKPNKTALLLTYQYSEKGDYYVHGNKFAGVPTVNSSQYIGRIGHSFELATVPAYFYAQAPIGAIHPQGMSGDSGVGDTSFALAVWPYANRETKTYFGLAGYLTVPTGSYDASRAFNMGDNRYKTALQAGFQTPVAEKIAFMTAFDTVWFGDNSEYQASHKKLEQDALYTFQAGLKYDFNPQYSIAGNYYYSFGGETSVNNLDRNDQTQLQRYQLSGVGNYSFGRIVVQYGSDLKTENGYFEDHRLLMRYLMVF